MKNGLTCFAQKNNQSLHKPCGHCHAYGAIAAYSADDCRKDPRPGRVECLGIKPFSVDVFFVHKIDLQMVSDLNIPHR
jgi:hypothetical protein